jgi:hypothetical protein
VRPDQLGSDLPTVRVARCRGSGQAHPSADEHRFDRWNRQVEGLGQLGVAHSAQLAHQQRRSLLFGEPADVHNQATQVLLLLGRGHRVADGGSKRFGLEADHRRRPPNLIDTAVVRHAIEPRPQGQFSVVRAKARERPHEDVLQRVLGILARAGQHLPHIREQPRPVTVVDGAKGLVVACTKQLDELLVRTKPKQRRPNRRPACGQSRPCMNC